MIEDDNVKEHIDRCFASVNGQLQFSHAIVEHLPNSVSDHQALCHYLDGVSNKIICFGKRFHFEKAWIGEALCDKIVEQEWNSFDRCNVSMQEIFAGMSRCANKLMRWNKFSFNHIKIRLTHWNQIFSDLISKLPTAHNIRLLHNTEHEIDCLLEKEET